MRRQNRKKKKIKLRVKRRKIYKQKGGFLGPVMKAMIVDAPKFVMRGIGVGK